MQNFLRREPTIAVVSHGACLVGDVPVEGRKFAVNQRSAQNPHQFARAVRQRFHHPHVHRSVCKAPPVINRRCGAQLVPAAAQDAARQPDIDLAPVPHRKRGADRPCLLRQTQTAPVRAVARPWQVACADHTQPFLRETRSRRRFTARPAQFNPSARICQLRAESKGVDCRRRPENRSVGHIANAVVHRQRTGDHAEQEFRLINAAVIGPDAWVRHIDRAVEKSDPRVFGRKFAAGEDQRHSRRENDLCTV